ncbi:hypothetical protein [Novosphingobium sp. ES2-1]|uniref:hypothetical protein n=1 Tax=Novosphingobium sp. ES2-1 TaxID=2780074 RepID=UPI00187F43B4|nr:hypothetical protein [Novosphingobium sp. ES2-1]QOV95263.1 hypothetical protein IM701_07555 [Novosphingobium sp. ES2-1]
MAAEHRDVLNQFFADLATGFAAQFGAPFQEVTATWPGTAVYDDGGSIVTPGTPVEKPCKAQFDAPTEAMRNDPGFLEKDMRLIVLSGTLDGTLDSAANVVVGDGEHAGTWSLESVQGDPAGIGWECRARKVA